LVRLATQADIYGQRVCKPNCKPTAQHRTVSGITS
jgi:hypothetical protein